MTKAPKAFGFRSSSCIKEIELFQVEAGYYFHQLSIKWKQADSLLILFIE
jgi:hypothetical protein